MNALSEKWPVVETTALAMGIGKDAIRKWRERGAVPGNWHISLIKNSGGRLRMTDFIEEPFPASQEARG